VKYWVCKTAPGFVYEAMEDLGGNGYVEESVLPRLYREAPVNAIWEGSGNVMCLDVLRALAREGEAARAVLATLANEAADLPGAGEAAELIVHALSSEDAEAQARAAVGKLAMLAAAAALRQGSAPEIAALFARTRLVDCHGAPCRLPDRRLHADVMTHRCDARVSRCNTQAGTEAAATGLLVLAGHRREGGRQ
jgi:putative acyl-CoA dehydrogenase